MYVTNNIKFQYVFELDNVYKHFAQPGVPLADLVLHTNGYRGDARIFQCVDLKSLKCVWSAQKSRSFFGSFSRTTVSNGRKSRRGVSNVHVQLAYVRNAVLE